MTILCVLCVMHHSNIYILVPVCVYLRSVRGFQNVIVYTKSIYINVTIINVLRYRHRALRYLLIICSLSRVQNPRFGSTILDFLVLKIIHDINVDSLCRKLLNWFAKKTLLGLFYVFFSCALFRPFIGKSTISSDV
jgi:hypothetical protein